MAAAPNEEAVRSLPRRLVEFPGWLGGKSGLLAAAIGLVGLAVTDRYKK